MPAAALPRHELLRLATFHDYGMIDTATEECLQRITRLAALVMRAPISAISLVGSDKQHFKAAQGLRENETSRDISFCAHGIDETTPLVVPNAGRDARFADNPFVTEGTIRAYFGAPLIAPNGMCLGMLCAARPTPGDPPSDAEIVGLTDLAAMVMHELEVHRLGTVWHAAVARSRNRADNLERVRERLENALASRSAFLGSLSHELRTPLYGILGYNELIQRHEPAPERVLEHAREISVAGARLQATVDEVLAIAGPGETDSADQGDRFDAFPIVEDVARLVAGFAFRRRVTMVVAMRKAIWPVVGRKAALKHALLQICINAIAACPEDGTVTLMLLNTTFGMTDISVFNQGAPMTGVECAQALTPLGQPCAGGGAGIGISLPICRVMIERLGGTVSLRGDPKSGGTFATIALPKA